MPHLLCPDAPSVADRVVGLPDWLSPDLWDDLLAKHDRWIAQGCGYGTIHLVFANGKIVKIKGDEDANVP